MTKSQKAKRLIEIEIKLKKMKKLYEERDQLLDWLGEHDLTEYTHMGHTLVICETFCDKNKVWKMCAITRYTSEIIKNK